MRRLTTALTADEFGRAALNLGRADENAAVRVEIDLSAILAQEPGASAHLTVESPNGAKYPASTTMDGGKLIWDVSDADTAAEGTGRAQLTVTGPGGEVLKSAVAVTRVGHSLRGEGEAPEPLKSWVDDAVAKLAAVESAIADAQQVADDIRQQLESGAFVGPKGDKGDPGPKGDPGDLSGLTKAAVVAALGYTPQNSAVENHDGEIESLFPDKITIIINNFYKQGALCLFVCQIKVSETVIGDYGFNVLKLPFAALHRAWINYSWQFYTEQDLNYIRFNGESLAAGNYTLSAVYFTGK